MLQRQIIALALSSAFAAAALLAAERGLCDETQAAAEPQTLTLAYYYPWYVRSDWRRHEYVGTPKLGEYGTDDPAIAQQHIRWAKQGGIDALVVSWWGPDDLTARHIDRGFLKAKNLDDIRYAIIYESLGRLDRLDGRTDVSVDFAKPAVAERMIADFKVLANSHFKHPSYLKLGDRPVVVIYLTRTFRHFDREQIERLEEAIGVDLYLIADEPYFGEQKDPQTARHGVDAGGQPVFDAYTPYNMFEKTLVRNGETAWEFHRREAHPIYERWSRSTVFCPVVMPAYHDFRGNKVLVGGVDGFQAQIEAAMKLPRPADAPDDPRLLFVTSFNEWWEGTTIEPAEEYGTSYLDALREAAGK